MKKTKDKTKEPKEKKKKGFFSGSKKEAKATKGNTYTPVYSTTPPNGGSPSHLSKSASFESKDDLESLTENDYIRAHALYDYDPADSDEIPLRVGDIVFIFHKHESGWWTGEASGRYGIFPGAYVAEDEDQKHKKLPTPEEAEEKRRQEDLRKQKEEEEEKRKILEKQKQEEEKAKAEPESKPPEEPKKPLTYPTLERHQYKPPTR